MVIPIYRHNQDHDDWEVASVYDSDDCDSMDRSAYDESVRSSPSVGDPAMGMQGHLYEDARPLVRYSVPQPQQPQNYSPAIAYPRPQREARYVPAKQSNFIVPPPGVIFPSKDWPLPPPPPPQDTYWSPAPGHVVSSDRPVDTGLVEPPPLPPSLLLSPSSPPRATSPLISPRATSVTGTNTNTHASTMMPPPPRYHELTHTRTTISPHLAEAGCQAHSEMGMSPPRRSGHDVLSTSSSHGAGPGRASMEMVADGPRYGLGGANYGPGDRSDLHPLQSNLKYEREEGYGCDAAGRTRTARPQTRERRPSIWRRFVRRFSPHVSVGQT